MSSGQPAVEEKVADFDVKLYNQCVEFVRQHPISLKVEDPNYGGYWGDASIWSQRPKCPAGHAFIDFIGVVYFGTHKEIEDFVEHWESCHVSVFSDTKKPEPPVGWAYGINDYDDYYLYHIASRKAADKKTREREEQ